MHLRLFAAAILVLANPALRADTVYSFSGQFDYFGFVAPQSFTYISPSYVTRTTVVPLAGLTACSDNYSLPSSSHGIAVTATCLGVSLDPTSPGYPIGNPLEISIMDDAVNANYYFPLISATELGTFNTIAIGNQGQLVVSVASTPEPSSFALLGTGVLGIVGVVRKRLV